MAPKAKESLDLGAVNKILARWSAAKKMSAEADKEIEACKTAVEATMVKTGVEAIKTARYEVTKRMQSRESVSRADLPQDIWAKFAKKSTFSVLSFKELKASKAKATKGKAPAASPKKAARGKAKPTKK
ncbi:unnamed protein product [Polarella glacialis]|uniref:Uncharacterized protein n=1 Tax=Polarella glacialis TaxID=89957 RepID=A0A813JEG7_POLGL|nr:unnamed protein product [Polarella glacialis]